MTDRLDGKLAGPAGADDAPAEEHHETIGQDQQLVEVLRDQQHRGPGVAGVEQRAAGGRRRARVEPARGIERHDQPRRVGQLAGQHGALDVAAR